MKMCDRDHVLERQVCWRQCSRIPRGPHAAYTRCFDTAPEDMPVIDILYDTDKIHPMECILCTPGVDPDYKQKAELVLQAQGKSQTATSDSSQAMSIQGQFTQMTTWVEEQDKFRKLTRDRDKAHAAIVEAVRKSAEPDWFSLDAIHPRFYYGPTATTELSMPKHRRTHLLNAERYKKRIRDWSSMKGFSMQFHPPAQPEDMQMLGLY